MLGRARGYGRTHQISERDSIDDNIIINLCGVVDVATSKFNRGFALSWTQDSTRLSRPSIMGLQVWRSRVSTRSEKVPESGFCSNPQSFDLNFL